MTFLAAACAAPDLARHSTHASVLVVIPGLQPAATTAFLAPATRVQALLAALDAAGSTPLTRGFLTFTPRAPQGMPTALMTEVASRLLGTSDSDPGSMDYGQGGALTRLAVALQTGASVRVVDVTFRRAAVPGGLAALGAHALSCHLVLLLLFCPNTGSRRCCFSSCRLVFI